jgi:hypothetical protein
MEDGVAHSAKWAHMTHHPEVTEMMDLWVIKACEDGLVAHRGSSSSEMESVCRYGGCTGGRVSGPQ